MTSTARRMLLRLRHAGALLGVEIAAGLLGVLALLGAAAVVPWPWLFLAVGFLVFGAAATGGVLLLTRGTAPQRRGRRRMISAATLVVIGVIVFVPTAMVPMHDHPAVDPKPADLAYWTLPSGSRIGYLFRAAAPGSASAPVVFLHGGPGISDLAGDEGYFGRLTDAGRDVYAYAQEGAGPSARLADPRGYTLERQITDLEAIRRRIGAEQMVLIGHSFGAELAAGYAARYPRHVARMVLISPGPVPGSSDTSDGGITGRLSGARQRAVYRLTLWPRALLAFGLLQVNPQAAHAFAGDAELDARQGRIYNAERPALHCAGQGADQLADLPGFYSWAYPQSVSAPAVPDVRPELAAVAAPTLILKGQCDYLSWSSAVEYTRALPHTDLMYLTGAGHNLYQDRPKRALELIRQFLAGRMPRSNAGVQPPDGFQGPA